MRKLLTVLLVMVSLFAMTATVALADGRPMPLDGRLMSNSAPTFRSAR